MLFDSFKGTELKDIAKGIGKKEKYKNEKIVETIAEFHYTWTQTEECQSSPQVFTIRDLSVTISSIRISLLHRKTLYFAFMDVDMKRTARCNE